MRSTSSVCDADFRSAILLSIFVRSSAGTLSPRSRSFLRHSLSAVSPIDQFAALLILLLRQRAILHHPNRCILRLVDAVTVTFCSLPVRHRGGHVQGVRSASISKVTRPEEHHAEQENSVEPEAAEGHVVHFANGRSPCRIWMSTAVWVSRRRRVSFHLLHGNGRVALDHDGHDAAECFHSEGKWRYVEQRGCREAPATRLLDRRADRYDFIGIDGFIGFLASKLVQGRQIAIRVEPPTRTTSFRSLASIRHPSTHFQKERRIV